MAAEHSIGFTKTVTGGARSPGGYTFTGGDTLGQYTIVRPLGKGGMGEVYEVEHVVLKRRFALKVLSSALMSHADAVTRFKREALLMAGLRHPNILAVDDFGETDGRCWLRMALAGGDDASRSLEDLARRQQGRLDAGTWRHVMMHVLAGLDHAHSHGIVHRDLSACS